MLATESHASSVVIIIDDPRWLSAESAAFGRFASERAAAFDRRMAGRQAAHDTAASARAAAKREERRLAIANRPRGQTQIVGHRDDGSPVYRAIAAFRARPYTAPGERSKREERGALPIAGMRSHEETREEAQHAANGPRLSRQPLADRAAAAALLPDDENYDQLCTRDAKRFMQRASRKVRMAAKRRRGW